MAAKANANGARYTALEIILFSEVNSPSSDIENDGEGLSVSANNTDIAPCESDTRPEIGWQGIDAGVYAE